MFKSLPKSKYSTEMLYFLTEHTLIKRKTLYLLEKMFEKDLVHFVSDSIFKRLKFDYLSSETVSNQKVKIKKISLRTIFSMTAFSWNSDKSMEINYCQL